MNETQSDQEVVAILRGDIAEQAHNLKADCLTLLRHIRCHPVINNDDWYAATQETAKLRMVVTCMTDFIKENDDELQP